MFCRKCGKEIATGEFFCRHCGNPITVSTEKVKKENNWFKPGEDLTENPHLSQTLGQAKPITIQTPNFYTPGDLVHHEVFNAPTEVASKRNPKKKWLLVVGVACCVFALAAELAVLMLNPNLGKKEAQEQLNAVLENVHNASSSDNFIMEALNGNINICVDRIYAKGDACIAACTVSAPDIATTISDFIKTLTINDVMPYTDVVKTLKDKLQTAPIITKSVDVRFVNYQGEWQPIIPEEMVAFCCGNVHELLPLIYGVLEGSES